MWADVFLFNLDIQNYSDPFQQTLGDECRMMEGITEFILLMKIKNRFRFI